VVLVKIMEEGVEWIVEEMEEAALWCESSFLVECWREEGMV